MATKVKRIQSEVEQTQLEFEWNLVPFIKPFSYKSNTYVADESHPLFKQVDVFIVTDIHLDRHRCSIHVTRRDNGCSPLHVCDL